MVDKPIARFPVSDESDAVAELLADFLDRSGVDATPEIMRDVIQRHGIASAAPSRIRGAAFSAFDRPASRDADTVVREGFYSLCLVAHDSFRASDRTRNLALLPFLQAALDDRLDTEPVLCREATGLLAAELDREINARSPSSTRTAGALVKLLGGVREAVGRRIGSIEARELRHPRETGLVLPPLVAENTDATDASIHAIDHGLSTGYDGAPGSVPGSRSSIERDPVLEKLTEAYVKAACDTTRETGSLVALLMTTVGNWRLGRPIRLVTNNGGTLEVHDIPAPGADTTGFDDAARTIVARPATVMPADLDLGPPIPALSDAQLAAIRQRAVDRPWEKRGDDPRTPFEWVRDNYKEWIPGLLQSHLKVDRLLYGAFTQQVHRSNGLPSWLDVPTEPDARIRNIIDPEERRRALALRTWHRERGRRWRGRTTENS